MVPRREISRTERFDCIMAVKEQVDIIIIIPPARANLGCISDSALFLSNDLYFAMKSKIL